VVQVHSTKSGVAHITSTNDVACLDDLKQLLSYLRSVTKEKQLICLYTLMTNIEIN
jgi:propionyl-CoA carboxylase beta chain